MGRLTLITGGARSGKSGFAEQHLALHCERIAYLATAKPFDAEMEDRIARHRRQRPDSWHTFEEPLAPSRVVADHGQGYDGLLLDCLTVLTTNILLATPAVDWSDPGPEQMARAEAQVLAEIEALLAALSSFPGRLIVVSNEVGLGIVPESPLSRCFRDCAGRVNQRMAAAAEQVFLVVSGIPVQIKGAGGHV
ncbi:bifunctional adenosylcobinamide kinase/adenosylcobinamide-phosphate guanylyltransferase [Desulfogranum mediterraneum]|uniref:bifunctional adenosylcobinamide kinase/adenosylcobinamide-phosphate guanylyltransferase n=1 Tax=Desulfogranum mediterraneum TaxID=160661 RepID=UPI00048F768A|nr:bifunctional adenosylcobinamide kinase/adenosylcobinamide-phosphate guanylyltransferase [Desulfogranum mediterraneum]